MNPSGDFYTYFSSYCDQLATNLSPKIDAMGLHILLAMATILLVWFGVQEALSAAQGGPGFNMAKFMNFFLLITFAYSFTKFYDTGIPGLGFTLKSFVIDGTNNLMQIITNDASSQMSSSLHKALTTSQSASATVSIFDGIPIVLGYVITQVCLCVLNLINALVLCYGAVATTIVGVLGPIFIPFMVFGKTEFLFWGWLKAFLSFAFFKVVGAATMFVIGHIFLQYFVPATMADPSQMVAGTIPLLFLTIVSAYIVLKVPAITVSIFSGSAGGHDAGVGVVASMITRAALA